MMDVITLTGFIGSIASITGLSIKDGVKLWGKKTEISFGNAKKKDPIKSEIAFVVEIAQSAFLDVEKFLQKKGIDATLIRVSKLDGSGLDVENREEWEDIVREFSRLLHGAKEQISLSKVHIFLAVPASLALAIGCTIGNLTRPYIYHFDRDTQTYKLVAIASNELR